MFCTGYINYFPHSRILSGLICTNNFCVALVKASLEMPTLLVLPFTHKKREAGAPPVEMDVVIRKGTPVLLVGTKKGCELSANRVVIPFFF